MNQLQRAIQVAREVVQARSGWTPSGPGREAVVPTPLGSILDLDPFAGDGPLLLASDRTPPTSRTSEPPRPLVRVPGPQQRADTPADHPAPSFAPEELLEGLELRPSAARLFRDVLQRLALDVCRERGYGVMPSSVVFHLPVSLVAALYGCSDRHLRRLGLLKELEAAGLLMARTHFEDVTCLNWKDAHGRQIKAGCTGTLWAVRLRRNAPAPTLRAQDWAARWRDFIGDRKAQYTVEKWLKAAMSAITIPTREDSLYSQILRLAVDPMNYTPADVLIPDMHAKNVQNVRELAYRLGELNTVHSSRRVQLVSDLASALCHIVDKGSMQWRALWADTLWRAWRSEGEGRNGLQSLALALYRLEADIQEWEGLRTPGALLISRVKFA